MEDEGTLFILIGTAAIVLTPIAAALCALLSLLILFVARWAKKVWLYLCACALPAFWVGLFLWLRRVLRSQPVETAIGWAKGAGEEWMRRAVPMPWETVLSPEFWDRVLNSDYWRPRPIPGFWEAVVLLVFDEFSRWLWVPLVLLFLVYLVYVWCGVKGREDRGLFQRLLRTVGRLFLAKGAKRKAASSKGGATGTGDITETKGRSFYAKIIAPRRLL